MINKENIPQFETEEELMAFVEENGLEVGSSISLTPEDEKQWRWEAATCGLSFETYLGARIDGKMPPYHFLEGFERGLDFMITKHSNFRFVLETAMDKYAPKEFTEKVLQLYTAMTWDILKKLGEVYSLEPGCFGPDKDNGELLFSASAMEARKQYWIKRLSEMEPLPQ